MSQHSTGPTTATQADLPRPQIDVITERAARPAAGGSLSALVMVTVDLPPVEVDRKPLNLALVIDRSGSMGGPAIAGALAAARTAVDMLMPGDWVSVVAFDSIVETPVRLVEVGTDRSAIRAAIDRIEVRGSTDLYGGWAEGLSQLMSCPETDCVSRVVILSDGHANRGVTDIATIASDVAQAAVHGVTTTTMGLGANYDENLLRSIADAGRGNYEFLAGPDQTVEAFQHELAGLGALRGRSVRLSATGTGISLTRTEHGLTTVGDAGADVQLPDLVAGLPVEVLVNLTFAPGSDAPALVLAWDDAITGTREEERLELVLDALDAEAFAALPVDERVTSHLSELRVATIKLQMSEAARSGDMRVAQRRLDEVTALVLALPAGEVRDRELRELEELRLRIEQRDAQMTARFSEKFARDRFTNRSMDKRKLLFAMESDLRFQKAQAAGMAGLGPSPAPISTPVGAGTATPGAGATGGSRLSQPAGRGDPRGSASGSILYSERIERLNGTHVDLEVVLGDITTQAVDAIVNSSSRGLFGTAGVDGQIHHRAGPALRAATEAIGSISYGEAVFTPGFWLPAQYVIHTATPPWRDTGRELQVLAQCYESVFALADRLRVRSLAIPAIGTGTYQYPLQAATRVAAQAVTPWLSTKGSFEKVRFVVFDQTTADAYLAEVKAWR